MASSEGLKEEAISPQGFTGLPLPSFDLVSNWRLVVLAKRLKRSGCPSVDFEKVRQEAFVLPVNGTHGIRLQRRSGNTDHNGSFAGEENECFRE